MTYNIAKLADFNPGLATELRQIKHKHYVDFLVNKDILIECKVVERLGTEQRQQLWNYMRLTGIL